jgi:hypothetical protein
VWFGDDGRLDVKVNRGSVDDVLFLEAEKFGFDIRPHDEGKSGMTFSFFDEPDDNLPASNVLDPSPITTIPTATSMAETRTLELEPLTQETIFAIASKFRRLQ